MSYDELTIKNKSWLKRFSHSKRFERAMALLDLRNDDIVMDYGTGDAYFLTLVNDKYPHVMVIGYEPDKEMFLEAQESINGRENVKLFMRLEECLKYSCSKIVCLEVLEHLNRKDLIVALSNMMRVLREDGKLIISVPIEVGFSSLLKNVFRTVIGCAHNGTTPMNVLKAFLAMKIKRCCDNGFIRSHIGFDFRDLEKVLAKMGLAVERKCYCPFPLFGPFLNSQVFFIVRRIEYRTVKAPFEGLAVRY